MNTSYYTGANLIIRRNQFYYPRTIYEGHPLIIQKNCNCNNNGNNNHNNNGNNNNSNNNNKKKKTYKQICPLPANNGSSKDDVEMENKAEEESEYKYKEPISPPKKINEDFKDFYFYEKHWRPESAISGGAGAGGTGIGGSGAQSAAGLLGLHHSNSDSSNWGDKMSVEANIVEANGHRDLEIRLCYVK